MRLRLVLAIGMPVAAVAAAGAGFLLLGEDAEVGYATPKKLCSVPVAAETLGPLLPPGDGLEVVDEDAASLTPTPIYCQLFVDDSLFLSIEVQEFSEPFDIMERYDDHPGVYGIERAEEATIAGEPALVGPDGALVQVGCPARGEEAVLDVNVRYQGTWEDPVAGQRDVVAFTEDLVGSLLEHFSCADAA